MNAIKNKRRGSSIQELEKMLKRLVKCGRLTEKMESEIVLYARGAMDEAWRKGASEGFYK